MTYSYTIPEDRALLALLNTAKWESDLIVIAYELGKSAKERLENEN